MEQKVTSKDVALFMFKLYQKEEFLLQKVAALSILEKFDPCFITFNRNGNLAIDKAVLSDFRRLTTNSIWDRRLKAWRQKEDADTTNSRQSIYK